MPIGINKVSRNSQIGSAIPDSVVSRPNDNGSISNNSKQGIKVSTSVEWPSIQARISNNTSGVTTGYLERVSDNSVIDTVDISTLSSGDVFTFNNVNISSGDYYIYCDAGGSSYTNGYYSETPYPYDSTDGQISITARYYGGSETTSIAVTVSEVGNINL